MIVKEDSIIEFLSNNVKSKKSIDMLSADDKIILIYYINIFKE